MTSALNAESLGSRAFREAHGVRLAYVAGSMVRGIASEALVIRMARADLLSYFGSGGLRLGRVEAAVRSIREALGPGRTFGVNFLHNFTVPAEEDRLVDLLLAHDVRRVEAAAFIHLTPALVRFRLTGLKRGLDGRPAPRHHVMAKVSRTEVAERFLQPAAPALVAALRAAGKITAEEAELAPLVPMADDVCAEADSGGHTDRQVSYALVPALLQLRERRCAGLAPGLAPRIGAAGGLGSPEAVAAAFMLGADFVLTGSINQCTVEAGTSDPVKDLLAAADIHDFEMAPAGDMFEIGAKVQVLRKSVMFPARANRLYELYRRHSSIDEIPPEVRREVEAKYFGRTFDEVWAETQRYYAAAAPGECAEAEANPRKKMAMIFRWYFVHTNRLAQEGDTDHRANFQIHSGPAIGALNRWLAGTRLEDWRLRHVDLLAVMLMEGAAAVFASRYRALLEGAAPPGAEAGR